MLQMLPYINEILILLSGLSIAIGWYKIRKNRMRAHKRFMVLGTVLAGLFFLGYSVKTVVIGATTFGGPVSMQTPYQVFLQSHSALATVAAVLGIVTLRFAYKQAFSKHKKIGQWAASTWFITVGTGLVVFLLLYVIYPSGANDNLFKVLF